MSIDPGLFVLVLFAIWLAGITLYYIFYFIIDVSLLGVNKAVGKVIKIETFTPGHWKKQKKEQRVFFCFEDSSVFLMIDPGHYFQIGDDVIISYQKGRLSGKICILSAKKMGGII